MENIEAVRMKRTVKCGKKVYPCNALYTTEEGKIPNDLITEVRMKTGNVEVVDRRNISSTSPQKPDIEQSEMNIKTPVLRPEKEPETADSKTESNEDDKSENKESKSSKLVM